MPSEKRGMKKRAKELVQQTEPLDAKAAKRLQKSAAKAVREHDRNKNDNTGRVHHAGMGK